MITSFMLSLTQPVCKPLKPDPEGSMDLESMDLGTLGYPGMNAAYALVPRLAQKEHQGKTKETGLCQCSVLGKIRSKKVLQSVIRIKLTQRRTLHQSKAGCSPDQSHQILRSVFILFTFSQTIRVTIPLVSQKVQLPKYRRYSTNHK